MKQAILAGLADILEVPALDESTPLEQAGEWNSLAVVATIALLDDHGVQVDGKALSACVTAGDVLRLAGVEVATA